MSDLSSLDEVVRLRAENRALNDQNRTLDDANRALAERNRALTAEIELLVRRLREFDAKLDAMDATQGRLTRRVEQTDGRLRWLRARVRSLELELGGK